MKTECWCRLTNIDPKNCYVFEGVPVCSINCYQFASASNQRPNKVDVGEGIEDPNRVGGVYA